jgi:hypothetical protein
VAPFALLQRAGRPLQAWSQRREWLREVRDDPQFDYGAQPSLRERTSSSAFEQHFQRLDAEMFLKILERQLLDAIVDFLDAHDIDTSDLKERETAILNNGVIVTGGAVNAQSLAVGQASRATTRNQPGTTGRTAER